MKGPSINFRDNFSVIRLEDSYYIDKTLFIPEVLQANERLQIIQRPKGWGKSTNLSLLQTFLQANSNSQKSLEKMFADTMLSNVDSVGLEAHFGQYEVLSLSLTPFHDQTFTDFSNRLRVYLSDLYSKYDFLLTETALTDDEVLFFNDILSRNSTHSHLKWAIQFLIRLLYRHSKRPVIVLLDDYDVPVVASISFGYFSRLHSFLTDLFSFTFRDNSALFKMITTATLIQPFQNSVFASCSGIGEPLISTVVDDSFQDCFGLSGEEVTKILKDFGVGTSSSCTDLNQSPLSFEAIQEWYHYGGDRFSPFSVLKYVASGGACVPYVYDSQQFHFLANLLCESTFSVRKTIEALMHQDKIIAWSDLPEEEMILWKSLVMSGVLQMCPVNPILNYQQPIEEIDENFMLDESNMGLKVSNKEAMECLKSMICDWKSHRSSRAGSHPETSNQSTRSNINVDDEIDLFKIGLKEVIARDIMIQNSRDQDENSSLIKAFRSLMNRDLLALKDALVITMHNLHFLSQAVFEWNIILLIQNIAKDPMIRSIVAIHENSTWHYLIEMIDSNNPSATPDYLVLKCHYLNLDNKRRDNRRGVIRKNESLDTQIAAFSNQFVRQVPNSTLKNNAPITILKGSWSNNLSDNTKVKVVGLVASGGKVHCQEGAWSWNATAEHFVSLLPALSDSSNDMEHSKEIEEITFQSKKKIVDVDVDVDDSDIDKDNNNNDDDTESYYGKFHQLHRLARPAELKSKSKRMTDFERNHGKSFLRFDSEGREISQDNNNDDDDANSGYDSDQPFYDVCSKKAINSFSSSSKNDDYNNNNTTTNRGYNPNYRHSDHPANPFARSKAKSSSSSSSKSREKTMKNHQDKKKPSPNHQETPMESWNEASKSSEQRAVDHVRIGKALKNLNFSRFKDQ